LKTEPAEEPDAKSKKVADAKVEPETDQQTEGQQQQEKRQKEETQPGKAEPAEEPDAKEEKVAVSHCGAPMGYTKEDIKILKTEPAEEPDAKSKKVADAKVEPETDQQEERQKEETQPGKEKGQQSRFAPRCWLCAWFSPENQQQDVASAHQGPHIEEATAGGGPAAAGGAPEGGEPTREGRAC